MTHPSSIPKQTGHLPSRLCIAAVGLLTLWLLAATPAHGAYEQVGTFAGTPGVLKSSGSQSNLWPEEVQLGGVGGMAVNYTGAGGVPAGTIYAATQVSGGGGGHGDVRVARYNPDGNFSESWTFTENEDVVNPPLKERCGPDGEPAHPVCESRPGANASFTDVDVDQSTGYVYVFNRESPAAGDKLIHVYSADGSELIAEFGVFAASNESIASSPDKIHGYYTHNQAMAVDAAGNVYLADSEFSSHRVMSFKPQSAGDYEHYVYAGQGADVWVGPNIVEEGAGYLAFDAAGDLYLASSEWIAKVDPSQPEAPALCEFNFAKGGILSIAVNPNTDDLYFYSSQDKNKIRVLGPECNAAGKFEEAEVIPFSPRRQQIGGLTFDPVRQLEPTRPPGVLYSGAPSGEGGKTEEEGSQTLEESSLGYVFSRPPALPPLIEAETVSHVTASTAQLHAQINPKGSLTHYAFQYETEAEYEANEASDRFAGAKEAPLGGATLGAGQKAIDAPAGVAGLVPDTTYRYRALASSHCSAEEPEKVCEGAGEAASFHTFPLEAPGLSDQRVYELVSPARKSGGEVFPLNPEVDSCRLADCKPQRAAGLHFPMQSSAEGDAVAYQGQPFSRTEGAVNENEYVARRDPKRGWQTVDLSPPSAPRDGFSTYLALSADLSRGLLSQGNPQLSPLAPNGYRNLYTQLGADPQAFDPLFGSEPLYRLANQFQIGYWGASADLSRIFFFANDALTEETPFAPEAPDPGANGRNLYEWHAGQLALVNVQPGNAEAKPASFAAAAANSISRDGTRAFFSDKAGQLYLREDGEASKEIPGPGEFLAASSNGSRVLLTDGSLYDTQGEASIADLSEGKGGFQGLSGYSDDLSHVYFVDTEVLSGEEENDQHAKAQAGKFNLYAWQEGGPARYVATLLGGGVDNEANSQNWSLLPGAQISQASPDGRYLAFHSQAPLSGYDNTGPCKNIDNNLEIYAPGPCTEVFLYDSAAARLICASCDRSGAPPLGPSYQPITKHGYLTDEGRLYFDSTDSLVPADTNNGAEDVYQYEPDEVGSCEREGGCVSLISAGHEALDSNFFAIDEDGANVFFTTRDQLSLRDRDDAYDLYDAREHGGIPLETETSRGECQGEACQALYAPPNDPTPGSSTFEGAGNVDEKKQTKKHKKKRKHGKKKHAHKRAAKHNRGGSK